MIWRLLLLLLSGLVGVGSTDPDRKPTGLPACRSEVLGDERAGLDEFMRTVDRNDAARSRSETHRMMLEGARNFFAPFPGGNGRSCAT